MGEVVDISYALKTRRYALRRRSSHSVVTTPLQVTAVKGLDLRRQSFDEPGQYRRADETCLCEDCPAIVREGKNAWHWFDRAGKQHVRCGDCYVAGRGE
jgi:hypothetical protein